METELLSQNDNGRLLQDTLITLPMAPNKVEFCLHICLQDTLGRCCLLCPIAMLAVLLLILLSTYLHMLTTLFFLLPPAVLYNI